MSENNQTEKIYLVKDQKSLEWYTSKKKTAKLIDLLLTDDEAKKNEMIETLKEKRVYFKPENEEQKKRVYDLLKGHVEALIIKIKDDIYHDLLKHYIYPVVEKKGSKKNPTYVPMAVYENLQALLDYKKIKVRYNRLSKEWECDIDSNKNSVYTKLKTIMNVNGLKIGKEETVTFTRTIAMENSYQPVRDYLLECKKAWDKKSRINDLCDSLKCEEWFDDNQKRKLMVKWLVNTVMIVFNDGQYGCFGVLTLQGKQGLGKTRWINSIVPNRDWLKTGAELDPSDKDKVRQVTSYWIVELGELDCTMKKDQGKLKQFLTETFDEYRLQYDVEMVKYPRMTSFYATVNDEEFLRDTTGNRRYWVLPVKEINVDHGIDLTQLWGEVMHLWESGEVKPYLTQEETETLGKDNKVFETKGLIYSKLETMFKWEAPSEAWSKMKASEIAVLVNASNKAIAKSLEDLGATKKVTNQGVFWTVPPLKDEYDSTQYVVVENHNETEECPF